MLITNEIKNRLIRHSFTSATNDATIHIVDREKRWLPERIDRYLAVLTHQYPGCHHKIISEVVYIGTIHLEDHNPVVTGIEYDDFVFKYGGSTGKLQLSGAGTFSSDSPDQFSFRIAYPDGIQLLVGQEIVAVSVLEQIYDLSRKFLTQIQRD